MQILISSNPDNTSAFIICNSVTPFNIIEYFKAGRSSHPHLLALPVVEPNSFPFDAIFSPTLSNNSVGTLEGEGVSASAASSASLFLGDTSSERAITAVGLTFTFRPNPSITKDEVAQLTVIGNESGGSRTIPVRVYLGEEPESNVTSLINNG